MSEQVFTIFQGPDAGRQFAVGDQPVTLGRDEARDVPLNDDRASRLHARIIPQADGLSIVDENSSNGTFVNGVLVRESRIGPGDIIVIGANNIVFGPRKPTPEQMAAARSGAMKAVPSQVPGATTHLLPESTKPPEVAESRLGAIVEAVAESVRKDALLRGIHLSVELEARPDAASVDPQQIFRALAGLMEHFLQAVPPASHPESASRTECALAVRLTASTKHEGFEIEIFGVGLPVPRERMAPDMNHQALRDARRVIAAHGGAMEAVPGDAPATLVRIFIPRSSTGTMHTMMR